MQIYLRWSFLYFRSHLHIVSFPAKFGWSIYLKYPSPRKTMLRLLYLIMVAVDLATQRPAQSRFAHSHDDIIEWKHIPRFLAFCAENSPVSGELSAQRPVTRSFDVFFDLHLNKQLSTQSRDGWFETPSGSLWRQCNDPLFKWSSVWFNRTGLISDINVPLVLFFLVMRPEYNGRTGR